MLNKRVTLIFVVAVCVSISTILCACQAIPNQAAVQNKDEKKLMERIAQSGGAEEYDAPDHIQDKITAEKKDVVVTVDASVSVNAQGSYPVFTLRPKASTDEDATNTIKALIGDKTLYETDDGALVLTKEFLNQRILEAREILSAATDAQTKEYYQLQIDMWEPQTALHRPTLNPAI